MTDVQAMSDPDLELRLLLEAIYRRFHHDFRCYSLSSLRRRMEDARVRLGCATLSELQARLLHEDGVFPALMRYLTVQVSDLFRDPGFFRAMREDIVPLLRTYPSVRVWIAGCSSGEEAYSFAILLQEEGLLGNAILYATDINPESLRIAEAGRYGIDRLAAFTQNHARSGARGPLSEHYTAAYGAILFNRSLRSKIVFSDHNLASDAGFAEMQLISCRNVLIYFDRELQDRALGLFRDSLCRRGFLGLGPGETLRFTAEEKQFADLRERWYQRC